MDWFVVAFLKASLTWLTCGVTLGVAIAAHPAWTAYYPAHTHMNLLGFVAMMIYGIAYHVIPRFVGRPLYSRRLAAYQWWASNAGLALLVVGFVLRPGGHPGATPVLVSGGVLAAFGAYGFAFNIWRTIAQAPLRRSSPRTVKLPIATDL
jgi:cbb3-type cytochrome oxidase subunit 1